MDNKCPKCGKKLSIFYVRQNCPGCGCNIMYYNMEKRLDKDAQKAEKEWGKVQKTLGKIKGIFIRKNSGKEGGENEK